jgi:hypothetical protein
MHRSNAGAMFGGLCAALVLLSACGGAGHSAATRSTHAPTPAPARSHVAAWPARAVAAFKTPWVEGCASSPEGGTSRTRCTTLFNCLKDRFTIVEFERLSVGYFQGGALRAQDRAGVIGCLSRSHIAPSG